MRIAVTYENGKIFQHFGHTEAFKIYEIVENVVLAARIVTTDGSGHSALAELLKEQEVDALICGGIGGGAQVALRGFGIKIYAGVQGDCDEAVEALLAGTLSYSEGATCSHHDHDHDHGHSCGDHCGGNCHE